MTETNEIFVHPRCSAIDALRGTAVGVWIISTVTMPILASFPTSPGAEVAIAQLSKSIWHGLTLFDFVLPAFLTAMGAALVYSRNKRVGQGESHRARILHITRRAAILFMIGFICSNDLSREWTDIRVAGVLQRIAVCYFLAALLNSLVGSWGLIAAVIFLLLNYWALLAFSGVSDREVGPYAMQGNYAAYIDQLLLPGRAYFGDWDPQGIFTTIPALATTLLGVLIGECLFSSKWEAQTKLLSLITGGSLAVVNGLLLSQSVPLNLHLWTTSFVLVTSGALVLFIAGLFWMTDLCGRERWLLPMLVAGRNSLVLVIATSLLQSIPGVASLFAEKGELFGKTAALWIVLCAQLLLISGLAWWLYQRRIDLTI